MEEGVLYDSFTDQPSDPHIAVVKDGFAIPVFLWNFCLSRNRRNRQGNVGRWAIVCVVGGCGSWWIVALWEWLWRVVGGCGCWRVLSCGMLWCMVV